MARQEVQVPVLLEHAARRAQPSDAQPAAERPEVVALMPRDHRGGRSKADEARARAEVGAMRREGEKRRRR